MTGEPLTGLAKAATLLIAIGPEAAAEVIRGLPERDIERLTMEIARVREVPEEALSLVIQEGYRLTRSVSSGRFGGLAYVRTLMTEVAGHDAADAMLNRLQPSATSTPFDFLHSMATEQLASFLQSEHPQTIALLLSHLPPRNAAGLLAALGEELQVDVAHRIATMEGTSPDVVSQVEQSLRKKFSLLVSQGFSTVGGVQSLVRILSNVDRGSEKAILESLERDNPDLAAEIRNLMFIFDDLIQLDDRSIQRLLRDVDTKDLGLALRGASPELRSRLLANLSSRAAAMLEEDMAASGQVRMKVVEEAQQRIVATARRLEEAEEITISRGSERVV